MVKRSTHSDSAGSGDPDESGTPRLTAPKLVLRLPLSVTTYTVSDDHNLIRETWTRLRAELMTQSPQPQYLGAFDERRSIYRVWATARSSDRRLHGREDWRVPGGEYFAATLVGTAPGVYELIPDFFSRLAELGEKAGLQRDRYRPVLEVYRDRGVIELMLPVRGKQWDERASDRPR